MYCMLPNHAAVEVAWSCGTPITTTEKVTGDLQASGVLLSDTSFDVTWGPCAPLPKPPIYDPPTAQCSTNPRCMDLGLKGDW